MRGHSCRRSCHGERDQEIGGELSRGRQTLFLADRRCHPRPAAGRAGRPDLSRCRPDLWRSHDPSTGVELHGPPARPDHADRSRPRGHRDHRRVACSAAERSAAHQPLSRSSARSMAASCRGPSHGACQPGRHRRGSQAGPPRHQPSRYRREPARTGLDAVRPERSVRAHGPRLTPPPPSSPRSVWSVATGEEDRS